MKYPQSNKTHGVREREVLGTTYTHLGREGSSLVERPL
jgi:hypothetical protein